MVVETWFGGLSVSDLILVYGGSAGHEPNGPRFCIRAEKKHQMAPFNFRDRPDRERKPGQADPGIRSLIGRRMTTPVESINFTNHEDCDPLRDVESNLGDFSRNNEATRIAITADG